jgi:NAD(P)-dependent dehydrogenase (short-subunit alcohol dehydrogenase family)
MMSHATTAIPSEQVIAVIGGSSGIGRGVAAAALASGAHVCIAGRSPERLARTAAELGSSQRLRAIAADISREEDVRRLFEELGPLDHVIVTAADIAGYTPIRTLELADAQRVIDSKLVGPLLIAKHAPERMRPGGSITFTSGVAAERPAPGGSVVAAVNSALDGLTRALALELAPIRVNTLSPGWVDTPVWDAVAGERKPEVLAEMAGRLPLGRVGAPADVAEAALFATRAQLLTGTVLQIDGGQRLV